MRIWLVRQSRRFYGFMGSSGGAVPYGAVALMAAIAGIGAGVGLLLAQFAGDGSDDLPLIGAGIGLAAYVIWSITALLVVLLAHLFEVDTPEEGTPARRAR